MSDAVQRARAIQHEAATPDRSVVLEAAAGSGKTKVLVDRFLRLCLGGNGVDPRAVLAITFTRRATVEIQDRLQRAARRLAGLENAALRNALADILGHDPTAREMERAAWFHEALLEDPGGLGIDTLHAFCQKVLGRFAADVGLDPRFAVIDQRQEAEYRTEALDRLETELAGDPRAAVAYANLARTVGGARGKVADLFGQRVHLQRWLDAVAPPVGPVAAVLARPLAPHLTAATADLQRGLLRHTPWEGDPAPDLARLAPDLAAALRAFAGPGLDAVSDAEVAVGPTAAFEKLRDAMRATALSAAADLDCDTSRVAAHLDGLSTMLLTGTGNLRKFIGRKPSAEQRQAAFAEAAGPVLALLALPPLLDLLEHNRTLLSAGLRALDLYADAKRRDGVVDFQDLEYLALRLLTDAEVGPQIHFRLDARLDHLLLDEFQDTNANQAELLQPLVAEVLAGGDPPRTAFVVGDVKQSIYGFRGAEPGIFRGVRELFRQQAGGNSVLRLPTNFRSLPALVETVGVVFRRDPLAGYMGSEADGAAQQAARSVDVGSVSFVEPIDCAGDQSGHERAAALVADLIRNLLSEHLETWTWDPEAGRDVPRPLRHDDILILARTKTHLSAYESALRRAGVPFLPAGRGLLARSREVQDVLALLRWLAQPADDTAGATVLRSPCFRLTEPTVQRLLTARQSSSRRSLREVLKDHTDLAGVAEAQAKLEGWFRSAGLLPLHDLLRRLVREGDLLIRFEAAGGEQARFNLLRLFDLALAAEARGGSLRDFVDELDQADRLGGEEEGALPGEAGTGRVRVMTVHGAKGLEAPVVILADAASPPRDTTETMLLDAPPSDGPWIQDVRRQHYEGPKIADGSRLDGALAVPRGRALERLQAEEVHILYVALTRARDRLVVVGGRNDRQRDDGYLGWLAAADRDQPGSEHRWHAAEPFIAAMTRAGADTGDDDGLAPARRTAVAMARLRTWTPPALAPRVVLEAPSRLDDDRGDSALRHSDPADEPDAPPSPPSRRDNPATRRGTRVHAWLEQACRLGEFPPAPEDADLRQEWQETQAVWKDPSLDWVFRADRGLSEVPILHRLGDRRITGFIDRLVLRPGRVDIVDYKSNRITPDAVPAMADHYRPQLAAYRDALTVVYPDREIRCWLVWTAPQLEAVRMTEVTDP